MLDAPSRLLMVVLTWAVAPIAAADTTLRLLDPPEAAASVPGVESAPPDPAQAPRIPDPRDSKWTIQVEAGMWYVAPSGKIKLPVSSGSGPGSFTTAGDSVKLERLNLDSPRFEPTGEVHLTSGPWRASFSGSVYSLDRNRTTTDSSFRLGSVEVASGDPLSVEMDFTTVEVTGGYCFWGRDFGAPGRAESAVDAVLRVSVLAGARFYDVGFDMTSFGANPGSADADQFFVEPIVGIRAEAELAECFTMDLQLSGGGYVDSDRTSYSFDIVAGFTWRPTRHVGVQLGYRQLAFGLADGDNLDEFEYDGRMAGLMLNLVIRF